MLLACGGLAKNSLFLQEHADIIGISVVLLINFFFQQAVVVIPRAFPLKIQVAPLFFLKKVNPYSWVLLFSGQLLQRDILI